MDSIGVQRSDRWPLPVSRDRIWRLEAGVTRELRTAPERLKSKRNALGRDAERVADSGDAHAAASGRNEPNHAMTKVLGPGNRLDNLRGVPYDAFKCVTFRYLP